MKTTLLKSQLVGLLIIGLMGTGCRPSNPLIVRTVNVKAVDDICKQSVEVHLVGVNKSDMERWDGESMTKYWAPNNQLRKSAKTYTHVMQFGQGPCQKEFGKNEPIRRIWKSRKAEYLYILADLPEIFEDQQGNADARRLRIPALNSECWPFFEGKIKINIESGGIVCLTSQKCE